MVVLRHPPGSAAHPAALTIGNFDGVHLGHRAMIERVARVARQRGLRACVMTFEPHPRELFAPDQAPTRLTSLREKLELLADLGVDQALVCRFDYDFARVTAQEFVERIVVRALGARYVLVGDDFRFGARRAGDFDLLASEGRERGFEVERMHSVEVDGVRVSSTEVRGRLAAGDMEGAARLLGRPYSITGRVVQGDRLGRELGFPTANVRMQHNRPPVRGIFAVEVAGLGPRPLPGAASLGVRPTVHSGAVPVLEVHLLDFEGDLYGRRVQVRFLHKLRDEEKYADLPTLTAAIARDVENVKLYLLNRTGTKAQS
jgi:riboflavin kinase/FMN adenylyltransferase